MAVKDGLPATDFSRMNREYIKAVAEEAAGGGGGGGGGIPAPENPSDGDVLTYSSADDEWVAAAPSGSEKFVVTYEFGEGDAIVADKTYAEILAAYTEGKEISALFHETSYEYLYLSVVIEGETDGGFIFRGLPLIAPDDPDTPTELTIRQESITHGITSSVESITESYTDVTIPLS